MLDEKKLSELYHRHSRELFVFIVRYIGSRDAAEDILHDCFENLIAYAAREPIKTDNLRAFLFTTARNLCLNRLRRRNMAQPVTLEETLPDARDATPDAISARNELGTFIEGLVAALDDGDRSVFIMKKELGMTYPEIAEATGLSERTVRRRLRAVIADMQKKLTKAGFFVFFAFFMAGFRDLIVTLV